MATGIKAGDTVSITAIVRRRVTEDRVSVSLPGYNFPHSIVDKSTKVKRGQQIELQGEVLRVDEDSVTIGGKSLGVTVPIDKVRLVESYAAPKRKRPLVDAPD
ncbi:hypothetical protein FJ973_29560 [Mesorhizobium sp. B2-1-3]|uniref:hypothetical protein n=1 Tax=Mesorhizobium sp. B2-1-3 TaxID=2589972 RepID=UPI00112A863F|nr:hypothetical protein [Mesorhizobium sp. B2-1-3]TPN03793.1 hypothetical protein FJ973_29560 [Mesorhizobium sp. B2-1-3]